MFTSDPEIISLFDSQGTTVVLASEAAFSTLTALTSTTANYFALAETLVVWMIDRGVAAGQAQVFVAT